MNYSIVSQPSVEPLSLTEAKLYLRVDNTVEDNLITALITAARIYFENYTWRPLCTQTWSLNLDTNEVTTFIGISKAPVQSISSITYFDENVVEQTMSTGDFYTDTLNEPARVKITTMPKMKSDYMNCMKILFVCGYGVAASVPEDIKEALKLMINHWYEHREAVTPSMSKGGMMELPLGYQAILDPYKNTWFYPYN